MYFISERVRLPHECLLQYSCCDSDFCIVSTAKCGPAATDVGTRVAAIDHPEP